MIDPRKKERIEKMAVKYENKDFSRVGRKTEGEPDQKYSARQVTEMSSSDGQSFLTDVLDITGGDLSKAGEYFISGANHHLRLEAGGYDEWQKAAKKLQASGLAFVKGKTLDEIVAFLKAQS